MSNESKPHDHREEMLSLADEIEEVGLREFVARRKLVEFLKGERIVEALRKAGGDHAQAKPIWPEPIVTNPDIADPTGVPYIDSLIHRLLDAQQDINVASGEQMSQSLCDASALIDEVETTLRAFAAAMPPPALSPQDGMAEALKAAAAGEFSELPPLGDSKRPTTPHDSAPFKPLDAEYLADWFYQHGYQFVVSDEEEVTRHLLAAFDIRPKAPTADPASSQEVTEPKP